MDRRFQIKVAGCTAVVAGALALVAACQPARQAQPLIPVTPAGSVSGCTEYRYDADARTLWIGAEGKRVRIRFK